MRRAEPFLLLGLVALAGISGCGAAVGDPAVPAGAATGPDHGWEREVYPFEVADREGRDYDHPFLGGLVVPRPQLIDIDDDGDLDLFLQERSNELMFLENTGTAADAGFVWRTDRFAGLDIAEWYRFVDIDGNGTWDLLAEQPYSMIRLYRNEGTPAEPRFVLAADTLRAADGEPLFSDRQNIPNAIDIDCNGRIDLFVGHLTGTVSRYEATEAAAGAGEYVPRFRLLDDRFEDIEIVAEVVGTLHGANTMDFADIDGDGDFDLLWGDFFEPGLLLLENRRNACAEPSISNVPVGFPPADPVVTSGYNAPAVGDLTGNGAPDMLMGVLGGAYNPTRTARENLYYIRQADGGFEVVTDRFLYGIDVGSESVPALVDYDGDGDLDLLVGSKIEPDERTTGRIHVFENIGTRDAARFREREPLPITGSYHYAPAFGDLTGDGRPDMLLGTWNDHVHFYTNTGRDGGERWELVEAPFVRITRGSNTTPSLGDLDGDGLLDLVVGEASGRLNYYRNTGTESEPRFELVSDEWLDIRAGRRSHPVLLDTDGDGDLDLLLANEAGELRLWRNTGSATAAEFEEAPDRRFPEWPYAAPAFGDLTGDGAPELLMGGLSGGVVYFRER